MRPISAEGSQSSQEQEKRPGTAKGAQRLGEAVGFGKIGAIERKGNVVARMIGSMDAPTLGAFVRRATDEKVTLTCAQ